MSISRFEAWIGNCHLRQIEGEEEYQCHAAVWADSADTFRARLAQHTESGGLKILWLEECHPVSQYLQRHGNTHKLGALARAVHQGHHVELSRLAAVGEAGKLEPPENYLIIEEIEDVEPLDLQFGIHPRKTVPDSLYEPLFGQPEPTEAEIAEYGSAEAVPPMRTYAVLDAAKMPYLLTGFIERSGLPAQSLFQGATAEELKEYSPYLVELTEDNDFTERLLTGSKGVNGLWERNLGVYIRSRDEFVDIRKHFRKFTRVQDQQGKWYYFSFWEPMLMHVFCEGKKDDADFIGNFVPNGEVITFDITLSKALVMKRLEGLKFERNYSFKFAPDDFHHMRRFKIAHDSRVMSKDIWNGGGNWSSQAGVALEDCITRIEAAMIFAKKSGFSNKEHIAKFIGLCEQMNETIQPDSKHQNIRKTLTADYTDGRKLTNLEYDVKDILERQKAHG